MPISNNFYGVWKLLQWYDPDLGIYNPLMPGQGVFYVVENARIGTQQNIQSSPFVQGTALPVILNVGGSVATIELNAPLLVTPSPRTEDRTTDTVSDGYRMWEDLLGGTGVTGASHRPSNLLKSDFTAETGVIFDQLNFSVDSRQGARYTIGLKGDANYLYEEVLSSGEEVPPSGTAGISLVNGSSVDSAHPGVYDTLGVAGTGWAGPFWMQSGRILPCRVGTFYDVIAKVYYYDRATGQSSQIKGYMEKFQVSYRFTTNGFNYVGQPTQRQILGISGLEAKFSGTMIWSSRQPPGYLYPWQAMNSYDDLTQGLTASQKAPVIGGTDYATFGGITWVGAATSFGVHIRNGGTVGIELCPHISIDQSLFENSTQQISNDLLRTDFSGFGWVTDPSPFS